MRACRDPFRETVASVRHLTPNQLVMLLTGAADETPGGGLRGQPGEDFETMRRQRRAAWKRFAEPDFEAEPQS